MSAWLAECSGSLIPTMHTGGVWQARCDGGKDPVKDELELTPQAGCRRLRAGGSLRGRWFSNSDSSLAEQGDEQLAVEPRSTALIVVFRDVSDLLDELEALEGQLALDQRSLRSRTGWWRRGHSRRIVVWLPRRSGRSAPSG